MWRKVKSLTKLIYCSQSFKIFAIYKIKDALREFGTTQAVSIKSPQYTQDALRLASILRERLVKAGEYRYTALADMWESSSKYTGTGALEVSIRESRRSLKNLANRSHTSVVQLLERSEMTPSYTVEITDITGSIVDNDSPENDMINKINAVDLIGRIKSYISEEDYMLLWNRFVEGMTVRELAPIMGISAPHVSDRTQALLEKLRKLEKALKVGKVSQHEVIKSVKETEPG